MKLKRIFRFDPSANIFRLWRLTRTVGRVGDGKGYSTKTTIAASPRLFNFWKSHDEWCLTVLGLRLHHARNYGGIFAAMLIAIALALNSVGCDSLQPADAPYKAANRARLQVVGPWLNTYATEHPASASNVKDVTDAWRIEVESQGRNAATLPVK